MVVGTISVLSSTDLFLTLDFRTNAGFSNAPGGHVHPVARPALGAFISLGEGEFSRHANLCHRIADLDDLADLGETEER